MAIPNARTVERNIRRTQREIAEIDAFVYPGDEDRFLYLGSLERKRDDIVRAAILQMHTAIESILTTLLLQRALDLPIEDRHLTQRSKSGKTMERLIREFTYDKKVELAFALRLVRQSTKTKLNEIGALRNKCAHNWLLNVRLRRGKPRTAKKPPLLQYGGKNLHHVATLKDFMGEYAGVYLRLFARSTGTRL
jgi:hypothetical protein